MLLQARRVARGWVLISGGILLVLVGMMILAPEIAGWVSGGLWAVLIVLPLAGYAMIGRLVAQERFRQASRLASWVRWLHPLDGLFEYPALLRGLELGQRGRVDEAIRLFEQHQAGSDDWEHRQGITLPNRRTLGRRDHLGTAIPF
jgi:hypothetical protein